MRDMVRGGRRTKFAAWTTGSVRNYICGGVIRSVTAGPQFVLIVWFWKVPTYSTWVVVAGWGFRLSVRTG